MKKYKNIDDLFREEISGYRSDPSGQVWKNIEAGYFSGQRINQKWYYLAALGLIMILAGGYWYASSDAWSGGTVPDEAITTLPNSSGIPDDQVIDGQALNKSEATEDNSTKDDDALMVTESGNASTQQEFVKPLIPIEEVSQPGQSRNEKTTADGDYIRQQRIYEMGSRDISLNNNLQKPAIDPQHIPGLDKYLAKRAHTHFYTGASAHVGMVYYPSTKDQFTWSADLAFGLKVGKFYVETGVGYELMQERGIYLIELMGYDSVGYYNRVESFEVNPSRPDDVVYNTRQVTVYDSVGHYTHSTPLFKYGYLNIPLRAGFRFLERDKLTVSANAGIIFHHMVRKELPPSGYNNPDYTIIQTRNVTPERVDWNLRWQVGIRMNYQIARSLSFMAEPVFTKYMNSVYDNDAGYPNVKPYTIGVRLGLYYDF